MTVLLNKTEGIITTTSVLAVGDRVVGHAGSVSGLYSSSKLQRFIHFANQHDLPRFLGQSPLEGK
jgi:hypothetical protein